jgi:hypothetical protein
MRIVKLDSSLFDWTLWRNGSPLDLIGFQHCRESDLIRHRLLLAESAVGYCDGKSVPCRPKVETMAVMFFSNEKHFWFHLTEKEFSTIFTSGN